MKIQNIKVRGAIGFKKGLGVDEIELDLSGISGLIALAGQNGKGKTTLLESLSPFRTFASRAGALRHHFFLRNSFRDLSFEYDGHLYRTLVKVDADSERSEGFIWKDGFPEIDGKVTKYDLYLSNLLGTSNLFYNSVFCAQNSDKISDLTTGQLKQLFVEFLRLDRFTGYENSAKKCIGLLGGMTLQEERGIFALTEKIGQLGDIERNLSEIADNEKTLINDRQGRVAALLETERSIEKLKDTMAQNTVNLERLHDLKKDIATAITDKALKAQEADKQQRDLRIDMFNIQQETTKLHVVTDMEEEIRGSVEAIKDLELAIEKTVQRMGEIQAAGMKVSEQISEGEQRQNELIREIMDLEKDLGVYGLEVQLTEVLTMINDINNDHKQLTKEKDDARQSFAMVKIDSEIESCKKDMALLDKRDPLCESDSCSFILSALTAKEKLPALETQKQAILDETQEK